MRKNHLYARHTSYDSYKNGFSDDINFWMGLDNLHDLTKNKSGRLKIYVQYQDGTIRVAIYEGFYIGDESSKYSLYFHSFTDSFSGEGLVNRTEFTYVYGCGGWWYFRNEERNSNQMHGTCGCMKYFSSTCVSKFRMSVQV